MQLDLGNNIKKYRKEMNLTQEELAEAFGVTVGAVSKWESGNTVPDILTIVDLADFYGISTDVLLGYGISSKNVDDIARKMNSLLKESRYDEAISEADKALVKYPGNFKMILNCAETYHVVSAVNTDASYRHKAIGLYENAIKYISQNTDPDISEIGIRLNIAELKTGDSPDEALKELNRANHMGIADINIALTLMNNGRLDEAFERFTRVLVSILIKSIQYSSGMAMGLMKSGQRKNFKEACDVIDWCLTLFKATDNGKNSYLTKMQAVMTMQKAMIYACLNDDENMRLTVEKAFKTAREFDKDPSNAFDERIRFWHAGDDYRPSVYDQLGTSATEGIESLFDQKEYDLPKEVKEKAYKARMYWDELKQKDM